MNEAKALQKLVNEKMEQPLLRLASELPPIKRVQTGLLSLDIETRGGLPMGVPISVQGFKSVGKSAFCYNMCGKAVEQYGGIGVLIQTEGGFVPKWAELCGLPPCNFVPVFEASRLDQTLDLILNVLRESTPTYILLDSLSMLSADPDKSLVDSESRGARAKPSNTFFRSLIAAMNDEKPPLFLYIEHLHPDVANIHGGWRPSGGETKGYANVMEIRLKMDTDPKDKKPLETDFGKQELPVKQKVQWELKKSKVSPKGGKGTYSLGLRDTLWSRAGEISDFDELLARCIHLGHVQKTGAWYQIGNEKYQGQENLKAAVGDNALRELALRPRQERGEEDGRVKRVTKAPRKRIGKPEGGPSGGDVPDRAQGNDGEADHSQDGVAGQDHEGST